MRLRDLPQHVASARLWDGTPLPPLLRARLAREWETIVDYTARIRALKAERRVLLRATDDPAIAQVRQLNQLRGVGIDSAWLYVMEFFAWRQFRNRRQVGGAGRLDRHTLPERRPPARAGDLQGGQPLGARARDQYGVGLAPLSAPERARAMVSAEVRTGQ